MKSLVINTSLWAMMALVGCVTGSLLYLSERRATTENQKYVRVPTYAPTMQSRKRSLAAVAGAMGLSMAIIGFNYFVRTAPDVITIPREVLSVANPVGSILLWLCPIMLFGALMLYLFTNRPLNDGAQQEDEQ